MPRKTTFSSFSAHVRSMLFGPQILAFIPAFCLASYWLIGEEGLVICALGFPIVWAIFGGFDAPRSAPPNSQPDTGNISAPLATRISHLFAKTPEINRSAIFAISIDDELEIRKHMNDPDLKQIQDRLHLRYVSGLRDTDIVVRTGPLNWIIALAPSKNLDLEAAIQQASKLQLGAQEPFFLGNERLYLSSSIGFTLVKFPCDNTDVLIENAKNALDDAVHNGPDAIRAYTPNVRSQKRPTPSSSIADLDGDIETNLAAWFQPQISTDTGQVCGFEALARWKTKDGTWLPPGIFIPILEKAGQMERLTELMLSQSLEALSSWDKAGLVVETVGVNFSEIDLGNPRLYEKIAWDLDRFNVAPHRLCIEILESVVAGNANEMTARNVTHLAGLGCQIDLDDFGTGHASISTLRRFPINRLKIDRSFVAKADLDSEQQKMVATILMMADRLGISCLAEGVETLGEHAILAQLGCRFVQGFGIAKPMPFEDTLKWAEEYKSRLGAALEIGHKSNEQGT